MQRLDPAPLVMPTTREPFGRNRIALHNQPQIRLKGAQRRRQIRSAPARAWGSHARRIMGRGCSGVGLLAAAERHVRALLSDPELEGLITSLGAVAAWVHSHDVLTSADGQR